MDDFFDETGAGCWELFLMRITIVNVYFDSTLCACETDVSSTLINVYVRGQIFICKRSVLFQDLKFIWGMQ